jgi:cell division protein FtsI (penicillin-binding protein 3)
MMLEGVTSNPKGTAKKARVAGYRVGGKTGTAEKLVNGRYKDSDGKSFGHTAIFAGMAPIEDPKIVAVVVVVDPQGKKYTGGWVAAPVFSEVVGGALRIMGVAPQPMSGDEVSG